MNTFGTILRLTTFGESHGQAVGGVIDGCPSGVPIDIDSVSEFVRLRRAGATCGTTARSETDEVVFLSGICSGKTLGTPIGFMLRNTDARSGDYDAMAHVYRPNHADYTYEAKYGLRDYRGGGRASARETVCRMVGGAVARAVLASTSIDVRAWASAIGGVSYHCPELPCRDEIYASEVRCPDARVARQMVAEIEAVRKDRDTLGGCADVVVTGCPPGLGCPVFGKLQSRLAAAMLGIPAVKGFEYGDGFAAAVGRGSEQQDTFIARNGRIMTASNHSGGIQGGITNGMPVRFRVAFKPIPTLPREMSSVDSSGRGCVIPARGRHDLCAVPRGVAVVEAMTWLVMADAWLASRLDKI